MDVLNPELMWIGQRCYRVNIPDLNRTNQQETRRINYEEEDFECEMEIGEEDFYEIETVDNGRKFQLKVHVPQLFHSQIIGTKGNTKRRLEQETGASILVPKIGSKDTNVIVKGNTRKEVISAKARLDQIMIAGRAKQQFTHFLSVPFITEEIKGNFEKFRTEILNDPDIHGLDISYFQKPEKLHLTLVMLVLLDNEDRAIASEFLQDCREFIVDPILQNQTLNVQLAGLDYMNDDPSAVNVLYGKVSNDSLQAIANGLASYFADRGLIQLKQDNVKMHVTLINSKFANNDDAVENNDHHSAGQKNNNQFTRKTFDASQILKKYKDYYFGSLKVEEIHLSQRFSQASNGFYEATSVLKLK
ncbi:CLUMA_CG016289, isoform A [Clunio marinus]|uniref:CLUMA_CG016289, isoform A n=1 Tax=Clunio marinus TaxID=568069 RepID=A0A1J1IYH6_9DIPT|nr:CLUMA_CG016289, isoform A [Clunio marinus]